MTLNKREMKFMKPAIVNCWDISIFSWKGTHRGYWNGDALMPVAIGKVAEDLIARGYLERVDCDLHSIIRATNKAKKLRCFKCFYGRLIDEDGEEAGDCPDCYEGVKLPTK